MRSPTALALTLLVTGCGTGGAELEIDLALDDAILPLARHARVFARSPAAPALPPSLTAATSATGLTIASRDADGDGRADLDIELGPDYSLAPLNTIRVRPGATDQPLALTFEVEVFDAQGNAFARQHDVTTTLPPGQASTSVALQPTCLAACTDGTLRLATGDAQRVRFAGAQPTALAAAGHLLAAGDAHDQSDRGLVNVYTTVPLRDGGDATLSGGAAGDQFGAALAVGATFLVVGAPGAGANRGAVYLYSNGDFSTAKILTGVNPGDRLGEAVLAVPDGWLIGAPGAAVVYHAHASDFGGDASLAPASGGPAGSRFGAVLAIDGDRIAVGAPGAGGFFPLKLSDDFQTPLKLVDVQVMPGPAGFGAAFAFAQIAAMPPRAAVVGAPDSNLVQALSLTGTRTVSAAVAERRFGASLAVLPLGDDGEAIVVGAPSTTGPGAVYALRPANLDVANPLALADDGTPAALSLTAAQAGDGFGAQLAVGDFDGDGYPDLAVSASGSLYVYRGPLP